MPGELALGALKHVWTTLQPLNLPMAVMGGIALAAWEHVRNTRDVDLVVGVDESAVEKVVQTLAASKIHSKRQPPILALGPVRIMQFVCEPPGSLMGLQVDLLLAESAYHQQALSRRVPARLPKLDIEVSVLACEDLIIHKMIAGRIIHRVDAAALLRINRATLDLHYLWHWISSLHLEEGLAEVWDEAFPGEKPPGATQPPA